MLSNKYLIGLMELCVCVCIMLCYGCKTTDKSEFGQIPYKQRTLTDAQSAIPSNAEIIASESASTDITPQANTTPASGNLTSATPTNNAVSSEALEMISLAAPASVPLSSSGGTSVSGTTKQSGDSKKDDKSLGGWKSGKGVRVKKLNKKKK